jgi:hypothetical protein
MRMQFLRPAATCETPRLPRAPFANRNSTLAKSSVWTW